MLTKETRLKASMYDNANPVPKFSAVQLKGLHKGFQVFRGSNMKQSSPDPNSAKVISLPAKVDYWLSQNEKRLIAELKKFNEEKIAINEKYLVIREINSYKFVEFVGKDDTDLIYQDYASMVYKLIQVDGKPEMEMVMPEVHNNVRGYYWHEVIEPAVEAVGIEGQEGYVPAKAAVTKPHLYEANYLDKTLEPEHLAALEKCDTEEKYELELYKLEAQHLEGLQLNWPNPNDPKNNLDEFRLLIFEHAIIG